MTSGSTSGRWRRVADVVGAALEHEPAARAAFLDAACEGDAELRREVESLLAAHDRPGVLDTLAAQVAPLAARLRGPSAALPTPRSVGRYRVGERLAGGGMGVVYEATDEQLGRRVALKFLQARLHADDSAAGRFRREARTVAALEHPNICTVHEIGESADGQLFIAMPLYDGETLQRRIARAGDAGLAVEEAVAIAVQVARGLAKAHGAGVVHRDVKPSNVFLTTDGLVKLLDFGIAKLMDATITGTGGGPMGTVAYMSPEQARGDAVDHRSDLWSLGVLLYEMLAGRRPFPGDAANVVLEAIQRARYVPLAERRPDVPPALATIVDTALAKSPEARYQSAQAIERDLLALGIASDIPGSFMAQVIASGAGSASRRRRRTTWFVAAVVAVALVAVSGALWMRRARSPGEARVATAPEPSVVVLPFANRTDDAGNESLADGITEEVITRLATVPALKVISRISAMHYKGSTAALHTIADELRVTNVLQGSVRRSAGRMRVTVELVDARSDRQLWAASYDVDPRDPFRVQDEIARQAVRALELTLGESGRLQLQRRGTMDAEAQELYRRGRFHWERRTPDDHLKAIAYFERAIARDSGFADAYAGLADAYLTAYQLEMSPLPEAEAYARHKWAAERALALDDRSADAHTSFAISLWWQRNWPGAERELRRALELNPGSVPTHYWYALLLGGEGRLDEARRETQVAASLDPFALIAQQNAGWACYLERDYACAIEQFGRAVELNAAWPNAHNMLSLCHAFTGRPDEAQREAMAALALRPRSGRYVADLALVHARAGRTAEARRELRRAVALAAPPSTIARAWVVLGQRDSAFAWLDRVDWTWPHRETRWDPALAPLRADPRWARMMARVDREMGLR